MHPYCEDHLSIDGLSIHHFVAMNSTPGRDVMEDPWVGAGHFEEVAIREFGNSILGSDNRHRTEQSSRVQFVLRHARTRESLTAGAALLRPLEGLHPAV